MYQLPTVPQDTRHNVPSKQSQVNWSFTVGLNYVSFLSDISLSASASDVVLILSVLDEPVLPSLLYLIKEHKCDHNICLLSSIQWIRFQRMKSKFITLVGTGLLYYVPNTFIELTTPGFYILSSTVPLSGLWSCHSLCQVLFKS